MKSNDKKTSKSNIFFNKLNKSTPEEELSIEERKNQGVYYSPSYLVQFVIKNTLGNYVKENKHEGNKAKILDPACGGGIFLVYVYKYLSKLLSESRGEEILKNNIYGVDKDEKAVKYTRLLLFNEGISRVKNEGNLSKLRGFNILRENIKCGDSLIDCEELVGGKAFSFRREFRNIGFNIIIGNPPWGANVERFSNWLKKNYPDSTRVYIDTYKLFIDRSLSLLASGGYLGFVVPNSFLFQPAYKDIMAIINKYRYTVVDLGDRVFKDVHIPTALLILKKENSSGDNYNQDQELIDLKNKNRNELPGILDGIKIDFAKRSSAKISSQKQKEVDSELKGVNAPIVHNGRQVLSMNRVFNLRDAGVQYASVGAGKEGKGKSDLPKRLFSDQRDNIFKIPLYKGSNINKNGWVMSTEVNTWMRKNPESVLKSREWVRYGKDIFQRKDKIVWRQTSDRIRAANMDFKGYFGKSIQAALPRDEYKEKIDLDYALAVFNSTYIKNIYQDRIKEKYRVFPQVKLEYIKNLPFAIPSNIEQEEIAHMVRNLKKLIYESETLENRCFFDLLSFNDGFSLEEILRNGTDSLYIELIYSGKMKKLRELQVMLSKENILEVYTLDSKGKEVLLLKIGVDSSKSETCDTQSNALMKFIKYYLENLPPSLYPKTNLENSGILDKFFKIKFYNFYDIEKIKKVIRTWEDMKNKKYRIDLRIKEVEALLNSKIYNFFC